MKLTRLLDLRFFRSLLRWIVVWHFIGGKGQEVNKASDSSIVVISDLGMCRTFSMISLMQMATSGEQTHLRSNYIRFQRW